MNICAAIPHPSYRASGCESKHPTFCCRLCVSLLHIFRNIPLFCTKSPFNTPHIRLLPVQDSAVISSWSTLVFHSFLVGCTLVRYARRPGTSQLTPKWTDCSGPGPVSSIKHADRICSNDRTTCACRTFTWTMTSGTISVCFAYFAVNGLLSDFGGCSGS